MLKHGMVIYDALYTCAAVCSRNAQLARSGSWGVKVSLKTKFSWGRARISCVLVTVACVTCTIMSASAQDAAMSIDIGTNEIGVPPAGFDLPPSGDGNQGRWTVVRDATAKNRPRYRAGRHTNDR